MDRLEYFHKVREANEIAWRQKMDKKYGNSKNRKIIGMFFLTLFMFTLVACKGHADYLVDYWTCYECGADCSSPPSCHPFAGSFHSCYTMTGEPPQITVQGWDD